MSDTSVVSFFRPYGALLTMSALSHGLRRGLHSFAASRLASPLWEVRRNGGASGGGDYRRFRKKWGILGFLRVFELCSMDGRMRPSLRGSGWRLNLDSRGGCRYVVRVALKYFSSRILLWWSSWPAIM